VGGGFRSTKKKYKMNDKKKKDAEKSRTSPKGGTRGCLCKDGKTYNVKCCDGTLKAQGIGAV